MKKIICLFLLIGIGFSACNKTDDLISAVTGAGGVKELLKVSADTAILKGSSVDGYFKNEAIKILLPEEIQTALDNKILKGLIGGYVDKIVLQMNRGAEEAAKESGQIFKDAINELTIQDVWSIVNGADDAATAYLKEKAYSKLFELYQPKITSALESVGAIETWSLIAQGYNLVFPSNPVQTNLADYTTGKALDGLFKMIADQEGEIRKDPAAQVSSILQELFG